jgi:hypothetical protein
MQTYKAIAGQSIYDVCLQTYGSLDYLYKLMQDNGVNGLDDQIYSRQEFTWDDTLAIDQLINAAFSATNQLYSTDMTSLGNVYFVTQQAPIISMPNVPSAPYVPPAATGIYTINLSTAFTSSQDGITQVTPLDINSNNLIGYDIVQVEREIKPLFNSDWSWNKATGVLSLLNGITIDAGQSLFILYSKTVS